MTGACRWVSLLASCAAVASLGGCFVDLPPASEGSTTATSSGVDTTTSGATTSAATSSGATTSAASSGADASSTEAGSSAATATDGSSGSSSAGDTTGVPDTTGTTGCVPTPWYPDLDMDGHGDPAGEVLACEAPAGMIAAGGDCRDDAPLIHPGADEVCDTIDNDCDAYVDEYSLTNTWCDGCSMSAIAGRVYHRCTAPRSWSAARTVCQDRYADLVVLELSAEHDALAAIEVPGGTRWWIGLGDAALEGSFVWVDGASLVLAQAKWGAGQPDNYQGAEDCVELVAAGTWNDQACAKSLPFVCEGPQVGS